MSTHGPFVTSAASQRFHWNAYEIGKAPFHVPTLADRKCPSTGCASPLGSLIDGYATFDGGVVETISIASQSGSAAAIPPPSAACEPPLAVIVASWPDPLTYTIFVPSG